MFSKKIKNHHRYFDFIFACILAGLNIFPVTSVHAEDDFLKSLQTKKSAIEKPAATPAPANASSSDNARTLKPAIPLDAIKIDESSTSPTTPSSPKADKTTTQKENKPATKPTKELRKQDSAKKKSVQIYDVNDVFPPNPVGLLVCGELKYLTYTRITSCAVFTSQNGRFYNITVPESVSYSFYVGQIIQVPRAKAMTITRKGILGNYDVQLAR